MVPSGPGKRMFRRSGHRFAGKNMRQSMTPGIYTRAARPAEALLNLLVLCRMGAGPGGNGSSDCPPHANRLNRRIAGPAAVPELPFQQLSAMPALRRVAPDHLL